MSKIIVPFIVSPCGTFMLLRVGAFVMKFNLCDILYIKANRNYCIVICNNIPEPFTASISISVLEKALQNTRYVRCHNSFIVNLDLFNKFSLAQAAFIMMPNGKSIPISAKYHDIFLAKLSGRHSGMP